MLDQYDPEVGWTMSNLAGETSIADDDELYPPPPGQSTRSVSAEIEVIEHNDRFLPVPVFPLSVRMADDSDENWRFDPATGTIYGRDVTTAGESYSVDAREPRPSPALLRGAEDLPLERRASSPGSPTCRRSTRRSPTWSAELTADAAGPYERVRAILDYLTDRSNGFIYSLATAPGTQRRRPRRLPRASSAATASSTPARWPSWSARPASRRGWRWATPPAPSGTTAAG